MDEGEIILSVNQFNEKYINKQTDMNHQEIWYSLIRNEDNKPWIC